MTSRVDRINSGVDAGIGVFEHFAASLAIPVADGVVAWLAAENMVTTLGFSWPVAIMTGVALEGCGIVASRAALTVRYFNQTHKGEPPALEWLAWAILAVQFIISAVLVMVNTVWLNGMTFGLLTLATLSAVGTLAHMLESDVRARQSSADVAPNAPVTPPEQAPIGAKPTKRERVLAYFKENPHETSAKAAEELGLVPQTVRSWRATLVATGALPRNGEGGAA
jgi:hypothetical protein